MKKHSLGTMVKRRRRRQAAGVDAFFTVAMATIAATAIAAGFKLAAARAGTARKKKNKIKSTASAVAPHRGVRRDQGQRNSAQRPPQSTPTAGCSFNLNGGLLPSPEPLFLQPGGSPDVNGYLMPDADGNVKMASGDKMLVACPGCKVANLREEVTAMCKVDDIYSVDGKDYRLSALRCSQHPTHVAVPTGAKCGAGGRGGVATIGHQTSRGHVPLIEVKLHIMAKRCRIYKVQFSFQNVHLTEISVQACEVKVREVQLMRSHIKTEISVQACEVKVREVQLMRSHIKVCGVQFMKEVSYLREGKKTV